MMLVIMNHERVRRKKEYWRKKWAGGVNHINTCSVVRYKKDVSSISVVPSTGSRKMSVCFIPKISTTKDRRADGRTHPGYIMYMAQTDGYVRPSVLLAIAWQLFLILL
jgi:hypothetical protein